MRTCCVHTRQTRQHVLTQNTNRNTHRHNTYMYYLSVHLSLSPCSLSATMHSLSLAAASAPSMVAPHDGCTRRRGTFATLSGHAPVATAGPPHLCNVTSTPLLGDAVHPATRSLAHAPARAPCWLCAISSVMVLVEHHSRNLRGSRRETASKQWPQSSCAQFNDVKPVLCIRARWRGRRESVRRRWGKAEHGTTAPTLSAL